MDKLRVLVVDDELGMRLAIARVLEQYQVRVPELEAEVGLETILAATGEEALAKVSEKKPDLLLLDHKLPGISGLEVLTRLQEKGDDLLTIMITAYASLETAVTATKRGAFDFLAKPFTPDELKAAMDKAAKQLLLARQAKRLAQEKRQFRFQLISVVAHELKAPLAAVEQYLNLLAEGTVSDDPQTVRRIVERSLVRLQGMRKLITDLLDLTRIESGQKKRDLVKLEAAAMAQAALELFRPEAERRGITLALRAEGPVWMVADRWEIESVLNNLISNAIKYNRDGGRVEVSVAWVGGRVCLRVKDTGIGIAPEDRERLFSEFVRLKNEQTENILGSGLGLAIVKKIALLYGGEVAVESEPGQGSAFTVFLNPEAPP